MEFEINLILNFYQNGKEICYSHFRSANKYEILKIILKTDVSFGVVTLNNFIEENPINESGYTAKRLYEEYKNKLSIVGVFLMLIILRETPELGLKIIADNFPTK